MTKPVKCRNKYCYGYTERQSNRCAHFWGSTKDCVYKKLFDRDFPVKVKPKPIINVRQYLAEIETAHKKAGKSKLVFKRRKA